MNKFYTIENFNKIPDYSACTIVFGGTFDPIHQGHVADIKKLIEVSNSVYLAPTHQNPWKLTNPTPLAMRIEMISLTLAAEKISYELIEQNFNLATADRKDVKIITTPYTYSVDILDLLKKHKITNVFWAIGEDLIESAPNWMGWQDAGVPFIVLPLIEGFSATSVRENSIKPHKAIEQYIIANSLYNNSASS